MQTVLDADLQCDQDQCDYFILIEGYADTQGVYSVSMDCDGAPAATINGTIACGGVATGSTVGAASNHGNEAGEAFWAFELPVHTAVQFDSCASSFDTWLRVMAPNMNELDGCDE